MKSEYHRADERSFLDERGSSAATAPNGLNPATIMEKALVDRITESIFYQDQCFGINEADVVDRVVSEVKFLGGTYGPSSKPTPFLCLAFKLLQLAPGDDILREYLDYGGEKFKYLRCLALFYVRMTRRAPDVFRTLEPHLKDYRRVRWRGRDEASLLHVDEFVDQLLNEDRLCGTSFLKMPRREILEELDELDPYVSPLGDWEELLDEMEGVKDEGGQEDGEEGLEEGEERNGGDDGPDEDANGDEEAERSRTSHRDEMDVDDTEEGR